MLKFKKDGKVLGVLKDDATEHEGVAFEFTDEIKPNTEIATETEEPVEESEECSNSQNGKEAKA